MLVWIYRLIQTGTTHGDVIDCDIAPEVGDGAASSDRSQHDEAGRCVERNGHRHPRVCADIYGNEAHDIQASSHNCSSWIQIAMRTLSCCDVFTFKYSNPTLIFKQFYILHIMPTSNSLGSEGHGFNIR